MIRRLVDRYFNEDDKYSEMFGLSGDDKPVEGLITGSKFIEVDTGIVYLFDEESRTWTPSNSGNGKTLITGATVTLGSSLTYDVTEKTKSVSTVKVGSTTLTENTDYIVKDNTGVLPGSYTMYIVGIGSYCGSISKVWEIGKGSGSVTASPDTLALTDQAGESTITVVGDGAVSVSSSDDDVATAEISGTTVTVTPVAAGSATVTVTLADGTLYNGGTDTISVTVSEPDDT